MTSNRSFYYFTCWILILLPMHLFSQSLGSNSWSGSLNYKNAEFKVSIDFEVKHSVIDDQFISYVEIDHMVVNSVVYNNVSYNRSSAYGALSFPYRLNNSVGARVEITEFVPTLSYERMTKEVYSTYPTTYTYKPDELEFEEKSRAERSIIRNNWKKKTSCDGLVVRSISGLSLSNILDDIKKALEEERRAQRDEEGASEDGEEGDGQYGGATEGNSNSYVGGSGGNSSSSNSSGNSSGSTGEDNQATQSRMEELRAKRQRRREALRRQREEQAARQRREQARRLSQAAASGLQEGIEDGFFTGLQATMAVRDRPNDLISLTSNISYHLGMRFKDRVLFQMGIAPVDEFIYDSGGGEIFFSGVEFDIVTLGDDDLPFITLGLGGEVGSGTANWQDEDVNTQEVNRIRENTYLFGGYTYAHVFKIFYVSYGWGISTGSRSESLGEDIDTDESYTSFAFGLHIPFSVF